MDFISKVNEKQKELGLTDAELSKKTGINEYTLYYVKNYRQYLTKVGYYALCSVLKIKVVDYIDALLEENKGLVGSPESNLELASNFPDLDYLERLEKELVALKKLKDRIDSKDAVINSQLIEIKELKKELEELNKKNSDLEKAAYSQGVKAGLVQIQQMKRLESEKELKRRINEE